jgi:hypothetical protein
MRAYICLSRSDIPDGTLQVLDLWPNTSQRNQVTDPAGQTKYINRYENSTLLALAANVTTAEFKGISAYLIDHVIRNATNVTISVANANTAAGDIAAAVDAGTVLSVGGVNAILQAATGDATTSLNAGGSNGVLTDLLQICAGAEYILPSGSLVGALAAPANLGSFTVGQYRATCESGALFSSIAEGNIAGFSSATFEYGGTTGAALVVYDDLGAVLS